MSIHSSPLRTDRRVAQRVAFDSLAVVSKASHAYILHTKDISESGAFLFARLHKLQFLKKGTELSIELLDAVEPLRFEAVITRQANPKLELDECFACGIGISIRDIDDANRHRLEELIAARSQGRSTCSSQSLHVPTS